MFSASYYKDGKIDINFVKSDIERAANKLDQKVNAVDSTIKVGQKAARKRLFSLTRQRETSISSLSCRKTQLKKCERTLRI